MSPVVWIRCRGYFFFAQQDFPSLQVVVFLCAQPLIPTARIEAMMRIKFFIGGFLFGV